MNYKTEKNRIYAEDSRGIAVAEITFPAVDCETVDINHTFVDDSLRGRGVASELVEAACREIRKQGKKAVTSCSYAAAWLKKHPQYSDILK